MIQQLLFPPLFKSYFNFIKSKMTLLIFFHNLKLVGVSDFVYQSRFDYFLRLFLRVPARILGTFSCSWCRGSQSETITRKINYALTTIDT